MKKLLIIIIIAVAVVFIFLLRGQERAPVEESESVREPEAPSLGVPAPGHEDVPEMIVNDGGEVREFVLEAKNFEFSEETLTVNKGDTVRIVLRNVGGFHDWRIEGFNTGTRRIGEGQEATVEFVADQAGTFEYFCSVNNHRQLGMRGTLTVTE